MNYKDISKSRSCIMGFAMIMIIIFHTDIQYHHLLDIIKNYGDFGVNLFFAISGFSMCYAWKKEADTKKFLKNRFLRIGITYFPISIVWCFLTYLMHESTFVEMICKILTIQFWLDGNLLQWFVSAILVFYLFTPIWMIGYDNNKKINIIISLAISIVCLFLPIFVSGLFKYSLFFQRVPSYILGLFLGKITIEEKEYTVFSKLSFFSTLFIAVVLLIIIDFSPFNFKYKYIIYMFLTYPVLMMLSFIFSKLKESNWLVKFFIFMGGITLEIYLLHEKILKIANIIKGKLPIIFDQRNIIINILVIAITICIAFLYHKIDDYFYKKIRFGKNL